jgi:hypothetical protein
MYLRKRDIYVQIHTALLPRRPTSVTIAVALLFQSFRQCSGFYSFRQCSVCLILSDIVAVVLLFYTLQRLSCSFKHCSGCLTLSDIVAVSLRFQTLQRVFCSFRHCSGCCTLSDTVAVALVFQTL